MKLTLSIWLLALSAFAAGPITNTTYTVKFTASTNCFLGPTNILMQPDGNLIYMTTNPALPFFQWTLVTNVPATKVIASSPNYVAVTNATFPQPFPSPVFASVIYTNAHGSSAPLFSIGGLQGIPNDNPTTTGLLPTP